MKLTLIHPAIGRRSGERYIRTWQMEPLPPAVIAGLTPSDVQVRFFDDRLETIPYDESTDAVALSVETYTARRSYQIASEYRRRGVPVVMGGFHATLCPDEVADYAEAVVVGEAEAVWPEVIEDLRRGSLKKMYRGTGRPSLARLRPDRSIFRGKPYLPITLMEAGRGCHFKCDFCAIQSFFESTQTRRDPNDILAEIRALPPNPNRLFFFVDDNITSNLEGAKALYRALIPLKIKWVSQASINAAHDEEFLELIVRSGCQGLLVGFESLNPENLRAMNKGFNLMKGGYSKALENLRRHGVRLYATFIFGYDSDTSEVVRQAVRFALDQRFFIVAFNHLTPFPGTPLYDRLRAEGRLLYDAWWLDGRYRYNTIPFRPASMTPEELQRECFEARKAFYTLPSILRRSWDPVQRSDGFMFRNFFVINGMIRREIAQRDGYPLGDEAWPGSLVKAA